MLAQHCLYSPPPPVNPFVCIAYPALSNKSLRLIFPFLQCIRLAEGYDLKRKCTREVVRLIKKLHPEPHPHYSHQCLELMVNVCLLEQLRGRGRSDIIAAVKSLPHYNSMFTYLILFNAHHCAGPLLYTMYCHIHAVMLTMLTIEDLQLLCLTYIHVTYAGTVPLCLVDTPTSGHTHPTRLGSKVSCACLIHDGSVTHVLNYFTRNHS